MHLRHEPIGPFGEFDVNSCRSDRALTVLEVSLVLAREQATQAPLAISMILPMALVSLAKVKTALEPAFPVFQEPTLQLAPALAARRALTPRVWA